MRRRRGNPLHGASALATGLCVAICVARARTPYPLAPGPRAAARSSAGAASSLGSTSPAWLATSRQADPRSCKPTSPVLVTLGFAPAAAPPLLGRSASQPPGTSAGAGGTWKLHLRALQPVPDVVVTMWATTAAGEARHEQVWRGALGAGEERELDPHLEMPADAVEVFAQAEVPQGPDAVMRSVASLPATGEASNTARVAPGSGRLTVNPETGESVVEFLGVQAAPGKQGKPGSQGSAP